MTTCSVVRIIDSSAIFARTASDRPRMDSLVFFERITELAATAPSFVPRASRDVGTFFAIEVPPLVPTGTAARGRPR
ncbi:hypothetical protein AB0H58_09240 [Nocardia neocaledoniensis]|uniref:hypothetical protein n=1 Tax=Nocardia TaxID=1817 RepID=UPI001E549FFB|nr:MULTISPECIES: hypothetical protein [Nocardia]UGT58067.1 hypothetical protein LTT85_15070 [Nocardia asteroides]